MKKYLFSFLLLGSLFGMTSCGGGDDDGTANGGGSSSEESGTLNGKKIAKVRKVYAMEVAPGMRDMAYIVITYVDENNELKEVTLSSDKWSMITSTSSIDKSDIAMSVKFKPGTRAVAIDNNAYYNVDYTVQMQYQVEYQDGSVANFPVVNIDPRTEQVKGQYLDEALEAASMSATNARLIDATRNQLVESDFFENNSTPNVQKPNNQISPIATTVNLVASTEEEFINLDLPSGTLWANRNVGANSPYEKGGLYGWGDATGYQTSTNPYYYYTSSPTILDIQAQRYDLACNVNPNWMMPTRDQFTEMVMNTTHEKATVNGVEGVWFISKKNSAHKMFLPMNGRRYGENHNGLSDNRYWTSTIQKEDKARAWTFWMSQMGNCYHPGTSDGKTAAMSGTGLERYYGCSIRPVKNPTPVIKPLIVN